MRLHHAHGQSHLAQVKKGHISIGTDGPAQHPGLGHVQNVPAQNWNQPAHILKAGIAIGFAKSGNMHIGIAFHGPMVFLIIEHLARSRAQTRVSFKLVQQKSKIRPGQDNVGVHFNDNIRLDVKLLQSMVKNMDHVGPQAAGGVSGHDHGFYEIIFPGRF